MSRAAVIEVNDSGFVNTSEIKILDSSYTDSNLKEPFIESTQNRFNVTLTSEGYFFIAALVIVITSVASLFIVSEESSTARVSAKSLILPETGYSTLWDSALWKSLSNSYSLKASAVTNQVSFDASSLVLPKSLNRVLADGLNIPATVQHHLVKSNDNYSTIWSTYSPKSQSSSNPSIGDLLHSSIKSTLKNISIPKGVSEQEVLNAFVALRTGEKIEITLEHGEIIQLKRLLPSGSKLSGYSLRISGNPTQGFNTEIVKPNIKESLRVVSGLIKSTLSSAANEAAIPYEIVDQMVDLFGARVDFRKDLHPGDTFALKYVERISDTQGVIEPGALEAVSLKIAGKLYAAIMEPNSHLNNRGGKPVYLDEKGNPLGDYFLKYPLTFSRISSVFSDSRMHPVLKRNRPHYGVDFAAPTGTPVRSVADGVVVQSGYLGGGGNTVKIKHNQIYTTAYLHLNSINSSIKVGAKVTRGQVIGGVGSSGLATGPHLHYSLYKNGQYTDPLKEPLADLIPNRPAMDPKLLRASLKELNLYHQEYLKRVGFIVNDTSRQTAKTELEPIDNIVGSKGRGAFNTVKANSERGLDQIILDPRLNLKSDLARNENRNCDSLNVFDCK